MSARVCRSTFNLLKKSTDNKIAAAVLYDIGKEEVVHAGEFLAC
jgi:hypothetical protein